MKISTKILFIITLLILTITEGCNEEFGSDVIKDGTDKPALNYFYSIQDGYGYPTNWLYFGPHLQLETPDNGPVTAMEWNTTFSIESSFPLSDIKIESTESWLTCKRLDRSKFSLTAASNNSSFDFGTREGHVYITPINRTSGDTFDYGIDVDVRQPGRDLILYASDKPLSSYDKMISFMGNGGISKTFEVRADGEYTITKRSIDDWYIITHSKEDNTFFVTAVTNPHTWNHVGYITIALEELPKGERKEIELKVTQNCDTSESDETFHYVELTYLGANYSVFLVSDPLIISKSGTYTVRIEGSVSELESNGLGLRIISILPKHPNVDIIIKNVIVDGNAVSFNDETIARINIGGNDIELWFYTDYHNPEDAPNYVFSKFIEISFEVKMDSGKPFTSGY